MAKAWLFADNQGKDIEGGWQIVSSRAEAAPMTNGNAHNIMRHAEKRYPNYRWKLIGIGNNLFIVEGTEKSMK
jgi:hypothetical protein